jgi:NAD(P)-dependent dehydrogenase (short-subunit alcohol dehydrogenase family)
MHCIRAQIPDMNTGGSIVNVSSIVGLRDSPKTTDCCVSKFGVMGLSNCAAAELAAKGTRVNAITPCVPLQRQERGVRANISNGRNRYSFYEGNWWTYRQLS